MADNDLSTVAYIYKRRYSDKQVTEVATREHATLDQLTKEGGFNGSGFYYPITYGNPQGISGTFLTAQSGASSLKGVQLAASRKKKYGVITIDGEAIAAARGDKGAFYDLVTRVTDGVLDEMGDSLAFDLFRDGTGMRGRGASISTNTVTLSNPEDVRNFKVGMTVIASPNANGTSARTGSTTIAALSRSAGTILLTSAAAITSLGATDYYFRAGDVGTCMEGFESSTPLTAPTAGDSFRGIDRSVDVEALSGTRVTTASIIEEDMGLCAVNCSTLGKKLKKGALNPIELLAPSSQLASTRRSKYQRRRRHGRRTASSTSIIQHPRRARCSVYSDPDCPTDARPPVRPRGARTSSTLDELPFTSCATTVKSVAPLDRSPDGDRESARARWLNYLQYRHRRARRRYLLAAVNPGAGRSSDRLVPLGSDASGAFACWFEPGRSREEKIPCHSHQTRIVARSRNASRIRFAFSARARPRLRSRCRFRRLERPPVGISPSVVSASATTA
jgi:hypothetical protein